MPKYNPMPPLERLRELLEVVELPSDNFGELSGLVWKVRRRGIAKAGSVAGSPRPDSGNPKRVDWIVGIDGSVYVVSRVIYFMAYGEDPGDIEVDHKDQNSLNNNVWNLRLDVNGSIQEINKPTRRDNVSGVVGVSQRKETRKWRAAASKKHLGYFTCKTEAAHAVNEKWRELGWIELGRKLNDLDAIECDCGKCK